MLCSLALKTEEERKEWTPSKSTQGLPESPQAVGEVKALLTTSFVVGDGKRSGTFMAWTWRFLLWQDGSQPWSYVHSK